MMYCGAIYGSCSLAVVVIVVVHLDRHFIWKIERARKDQMEIPTMETTTSTSTTATSATKHESYHRGKRRKKSFICKDINQMRCLLSIS
jgi:hypothetical protein